MDTWMTPQEQGWTIPLMRIICAADANPPPPHYLSYETKTHTHPYTHNHSPSSLSLVSLRMILLQFPQEQWHFHAIYNKQISSDLKQS